MSRSPPRVRHRLTSQIKDDEDNDGSGSIKDFRNKMWSSQQREEEDKWQAYEWNEGNDVSVLWLRARR